MHKPQVGLLPRVVVTMFQLHLGAGECIYRRWVDALITWSALKFIILRYSFGFQRRVLYEHFIVMFGHGRQLQFVLDALNTFSEFWVPARGIAHTNITHNVTPFSFC